MPLKNTEANSTHRTSIPLSNLELGGESKMDDLILIKTKSFNDGSVANIYIPKNYKEYANQSKKNLAKFVAELIHRNGLFKKNAAS